MTMRDVISYSDRAKGVKQRIPEPEAKVEPSVNVPSEMEILTNAIKQDKVKHDDKKKLKVIVTPVKAKAPDVKPNVPDNMEDKRLAQKRRIAKASLAWYYKHREEINKRRRAKKEATATTKAKSKSK